MTTNKDDFTCGVCKQLFTDPVVHRPCGISFDRRCIGRRCPTPVCGQVIAEYDLIRNHTLLQITDTYRSTIQIPLSYYLFLVDTSTSMWYSDSWLPFAIGKGRLTCAKQVLNTFFKQKLNAVTEKISLVTFATAQTQRFDFETIRPHHLAKLQTLKCDGSRTALFDAIHFSLEKFERLKIKCIDQLPATYLIILTDGGSNFGREEAENVLWRTKELHVSGHMIQIGDTNSEETRSMCDTINYKFNYFKGGNAAEFVDSFSDLIESETRTAVASNPVSLFHLLPDVPDTPIQILLSQKQLA